LASVLYGGGEKWRSNSAKWQRWRQLISCAPHTLGVVNVMTIGLEKPISRAFETDGILTFVFN